MLVLQELVFVLRIVLPRNQTTGVTNAMYTCIATIGHTYLYRQHTENMCTSSLQYTEMISKGSHTLKVIECEKTYLYH